MKQNNIVTCCNDCPLRGSNRGHGENFEYCKHWEAPQGYGAVISNPSLVPSFCPLKRGKANIAIELKTKEKAKEKGIVGNCVKCGIHNKFQGYGHDNMIYLQCKLCWEDQTPIPIKEFKELQN